MAGKCDVNLGKDFVVVKFTDEKDSEGKVFVDLVLRQWLINENDQLKCRYPPRENWDCVSKWVANKEPAKNTWKSFRVEIIVAAGTFKQGVRRLERSFIHSKVDSASESDTGIKKNVNLPLLTKNEAKKALATISEIAEDARLKRKRSESTSSSETDVEVRQINQRKKKYNSNHKTTKLTTRKETAGTLMDVEIPGNCPPSQILAQDSFEDETPGIGSDSESSNDLEKSSDDPLKSSDAQNPHDDTQKLPIENNSTLAEQENKNNGPQETGDDDANNEEANEIDINDIPVILDGVPDLNNYELLFHRIGEMIEKSKLETIQAVQVIVTEAVQKSKRSIQHDLRTRVSGLSNNLMLNHGAVRNQLPDLNTLGMVMPTENLENFLAFEDLLQNDDKRELVDKFIASKIAEHPKELVQHGVSAALGSFMSKNVQLLYSGRGKRIKDHQKRNFSETHLCRRLTDAIYTRHGIEPNKTIQIVSAWLAGAKDREGGRKTRALENA